MTKSDLTPEEIIALLGKDTVIQIYKDGLSNSTKEVGLLLTDIIKTIRLFAAPFQLTANLQDRLTKYLKDVSLRVPKNKQISPDSVFAGQILQKLTFIDDSHYLKDYYLNLLEKSINKDLVNLAHPAFPLIIQQLSPDEIKILEFVKDNVIVAEYSYERAADHLIRNEDLIYSNFTDEFLNFPQHRGMYIDHLQLLNLIRIKSVSKDTFDKHSGKFTRKNHIQQLEFGRMFLKACSRI